jgi:multidrug efflux pump
MINRQQALADVLLKDPDVESLSSFVGIDGTNTTLNNGRFLINLKPKEDRSTNIKTLARLSQAAARSAASSCICSRCRT